MKRIGSLFDRYWLPLFLILSVTWLFAPAVHHDHFGTLQVISDYEASGVAWGRIFRMGDFLAATTLIVAVWRYKIPRRHRVIGWSLYVLAILAIMDVLFPTGCFTRVCSLLGEFRKTVHDIESVVSVFALAAATSAAIWWRRHWLNTSFLVFQLSIGVILASGLASHEVLIATQYVYEVLATAWIAWIVWQFAPEVSLPETARVRRLFGTWTLVAGILALAISFIHMRLLGSLFGAATLRQGGTVWWSTEHSIIAGLLLLYVARHIYRGQRRAALLLAVLFGSLLFESSLFHPRPLVLGLSLVSLVLLWRYSGSFSRNVAQLPLVSRLADFGMVMAGVLAAAALVLSVAFYTGRQQALYHGLRVTFRHGLTSFNIREDRLPEHFERHLRTVVDTVAVGLGALLLWSLFRPSGKWLPALGGERQMAEAMLARHSNHSEDFFKIWPHDKRYFFSTSRSGFIAYKVSGSVAFALADPMASMRQRKRLLHDFVAYCHGQGWRVCFMPVQEQSKELYEESELKLMKIGSSAVIDIKQFTTETLREKWWRWQQNRADKAGLVFAMQTPPHNPELLAELRAVSDAWLERAHHREQGFALGYYDEVYLQRCRLYTLRDPDGRLVAFANELPSYGAVTQRTVDLIRFAPDVDGAMSVLMMYALRYLHEEGEAPTFDLGFVPLAKLDSMLGAIARRLAAGRFSASGLEQFKNKFRPNWEPNYIAYDGDVIDVAVVFGALEGVLKVERTDVSVVHEPKE